MHAKIDEVGCSGCLTQDGRTGLGRRCSQKEENPRDNRFLGRRNGLENNRMMICEELLG